MSFKGQFVTPQVEVFFGDADEQTQLTKNHCRLKQIHSNIVVPATNDSALEADAHYTQCPDLHLCIYTADCMPIMMTDGKTIAAVHAGWKGLFSSILTNVVSRCFDQPEAVGAFIGPHIHLESFEFGKQDLEKYKENYKPLIDATGSVIESSQKNKVHIDLKTLAEHELKLIGVKHINHLNINTFKSKKHHSYRRDKKSAGRNLSWIKIIK